MDVIVYHGSNQVVSQPDVAFSVGFDRDFGTGFYVSNDLDTAIEYANDRAESRGGIPTVTSYMLDFDELSRWNCVFLGAEPSLEWFEVVKTFRKFDQPLPRYEDAQVYVGLVADYRASSIFESYFNGEIVDEEALELLFKVILQPQICFKSNEAIVNLLSYFTDDDLENGIW